MDNISNRFFGSLMERYYPRSLVKKDVRGLFVDSFKMAPENVLTTMGLLQRSLEPHTRDRYSSNPLLGMFGIVASLFQDAATVDALVGDLNELHDDIESRRGARRAATWLRRQTLSTVASFLSDYIRRISGWDRLTNAIRRRG